MQNTQWRCIHVRKRFERVVALHLEKQGLETFVPSCRLHEGSPEGQPSFEVPLFPGYVFFKCDFVDRRAIFAIPGVLAMVRNARVRAAALAHEIEELQRLVNCGMTFELGPPRVAGRSVTVEDGPLRGLTGVLAKTKGKRRLVLPISLICRSVAVEIDDSWKLIYALSPQSEVPRRPQRYQFGSR